MFYFDYITNCVYSINWLQTKRKQKSKKVKERRAEAASLLSLSDSFFRSPSKGISLPSHWLKLVYIIPLLTRESGKVGILKMLSFWKKNWGFILSKQLAASAINYL